MEISDFINSLPQNKREEAIKLTLEETKLLIKTSIFAKMFDEHLVYSLDNKIQNSKFTLNVLIDSCTNEKEKKAIIKQTSRYVKHTTKKYDDAIRKTRIFTRSFEEKTCQNADGSTSYAADDLLDFIEEFFEPTIKAFDKHFDNNITLTQTTAGSWEVKIKE